MKAKVFWEAEVLWDSAASQSVIDAWRQIPVSDVQVVFDEVPSDWVDPVWKNDFLTWWGSPAWFDRVTQVIGALP